MNTAPTSIDLTATGDYAYLGYAYEPIAFYGGQVLKCAGIVCPMNVEMLMSRPGMVLVDTYLGDRIRAADHAVFTGI